MRRYNERVSGPILDRIDIHQNLVPLRRALLSQQGAAGESTALVAARVAQARERQARRLRDTSWLVNAEVAGAYLRKRLPRPHGSELIDRAVVSGQVSARGLDKVLRLSWTLCDLAGRDRPNRNDVAASIALRRGEWAGAA